MRKYWIFTETWECVLCGKEQVYRERRYTPKPADPFKRRKINQTACGSHFF